MKKTSYVYCKFDIEGTHQWINCPFPDVEYLKTEHRHLFKFTVTLSVTHNDRDIEFIRLGHELKSYLISKFWNNEMNLCRFGTMSCEHIGEYLLEYLIAMYGSNRIIKIDISEDGENGGIIEYEGEI